MKLALFRPMLAFSVLALSGAMGALACSDYTPPDVPTYGPPNGLGGKAPPAPQDGGTSSGTGTGTDSGTGTGTGTATFLCQQSGGTLVSGTTCAVSWKTDLFPKIAAGGTWNCAGTPSCHGGAIPPNLSGDAHAVYVSMANYADSHNSNLPYINPCSTDPTKSSFLCDTLPTGACGDTMPLGTGLADAGTLATWIACGAPEN